MLSSRLPPLELKPLQNEERSQEERSQDARGRSLEPALPVTGWGANDAAGAEVLSGYNHLGGGGSIYSKEHLIQERSILVWVGLTLF